jgi:hypothetical protein
LDVHPQSLHCRHRCGAALQVGGPRLVSNTHCKGRPKRGPGRPRGADLPLYPLAGWGLGLAIHGLVTFIALNGDGVRERMLAAEIERLQGRR